MEYTKNKILLVSRDFWQSWHAKSLLPKNICVRHMHSPHFHRMLKMGQVPETKQLLCFWQQKWRQGLHQLEVPSRWTKTQKYVNVCHNLQYLQITPKTFTSASIGPQWLCTIRGADGYICAGEAMQCQEGLHNEESWNAEKAKYLTK